MNTLQQFIAFTKGWEYIIAIAFLGSFLLFWTLWKRDRPERKTKALRPSAALYDMASAPLFGMAGQVFQTGMGASKPCWDILGCPAETRGMCPAYAQGTTPCWQTKMTAGASQMDQACLHCPVHIQATGRTGL